MIDLNYKSFSNKTDVVSECIIPTNSSYDDDNRLNYEDKTEKYISVEKRFLDTIGVRLTH